jgi:Putative Ig domain
VIIFRKDEAMGKLTLTRWVLILAVVLSWGCDKSEPVISNTEPPVSPVSAEPALMSIVPEGSLQMILLPTEPTTKTSLYVRVSGARESIRFVWLNNGEIIEGEEKSFLGGEHLTKGDTIEVEAVSGTLQASVSVIINNSPPTISAVQFNSGSVLTVQPKAEDIDGDAIGFRYQWMVNEEEILSETTDVFPSTHFSIGDRVAVFITPYDDEEDGTRVSVKDVLIENKPPVITSTPPPSFQGVEFAYIIVAEDPEGEPLTYSLETAPEGMTINAQTGELHWSVGAEVAGSFPVKIKVENGSGRWSGQEFSLAIQDKTDEKSP